MESLLTKIPPLWSPNADEKATHGGQADVLATESPQPPWRPLLNEKSMGGLCCTGPICVGGVDGYIALSAALFTCSAASGTPDTVDTETDMCSAQDPVPVMFVPVKQVW